MHRIKHVLKGATLYLSVIAFTIGMPLSTLARAEDASKYTYDAGTQRWSTDEWKWDATLGKYVPNTATSTTQPVAASPTNNTAATDASATPTGDTSVTKNTNIADTTKVSTDNAVTNGLNSNALTGDANVAKNLTAGDSKTGDANAQTTTINSVHSVLGEGDKSAVATFTTNIYGDVTGDITIGPSIAKATIDRNLNISSDTNLSNSNSLVNNQTLKATSGGASVSGNTKGGNAKSGNANTVANVLNLINTIIAANKSFIGTINIYGNLNGDILVSPDFIPQLLGSNAEVYGTYSMPLSTNVNDDKSIVNNVKLNATTGTASVKNNTSAGSATSGKAQTNLTILNLTGHKVEASKCLLVFVNVMGKWVGMIVDAPGATSAAFGSGVVRDNVNVSSTNNLDNKAKIINNIDLASASGDATVEGNTTAGNARTGNATASANIANISTSSFKLTDWFGVLFINVFGTWIGSFGVDTAAGTVVPLSGKVNSSVGAAGSPNLRLGFRPDGMSDKKFSGAGMIDGGNGINADHLGAAALLAGRSTIVPGAPQLQPVASPHEDPFSGVMMLSGLSVAGATGALYGFRQMLDARRVRRNTSVGTGHTGLVLPR